MMKANYETFCKIVQALDDIDEASTALHNAVTMFSPDNGVMCAAPASVMALLDELIESLWGKFFKDDFEWWRYEHGEVVWVGDGESKLQVSVKSKEDFYRVFSELHKDEWGEG